MKGKTGRRLGILMNLAMVVVLLGLISASVVLGLVYYAAVP